MTKAGLNMITRTSAGGDYAESQIYMCSVDVGWVSSENPHPKKMRLQEEGFVPPLDFTDAASRIYDPIAEGIQGQRLYGRLLKNYRVEEW